MKQKTSIIAKTPPTVIARNEAISDLCPSRTGHLVLSSLPLLLPFVFCFLVSLNAFAQSRDSTKKDTSKRLVIIDSPKPTRKQMPLIVLDGKIYKRELKNIDPETIANVTVLKGKEAQALYGPKGKNGVVIVTSKK